jgi:hypothetical protein
MFDISWKEMEHTRMNNEMRQVLPDKNEKQKTFQNVLGPNFP